MARVSAIKFHFYTTNQELDHDSDAVAEVLRGGTVIGSASTGRNHCKSWQDGTHNDLIVHPTTTVTTNQLAGLEYRVRMGAEGNNKWRFKLTLSAIVNSQNPISTSEKGETELNSRGSKWDQQSYSWN